jgi:hypothetical protein
MVNMKCPVLIYDFGYCSVLFYDEENIPINNKLRGEKKYRLNKKNYLHGRGSRSQEFHNHRGFQKMRDI